MTNPDELSHFGVKGMKWGVRNARNENYSDNQRTRDSRVYGKGGAKRINRRMNEGESVGTARSAEKTRRDAVMKNNPTARQVGKLVGGAAGGAIGLASVRGLRALTATSRGQSVINSVLGPELGGTAVSMLRTPQAAVAISSGAAYIGYLQSGNLGVSANMAINGYDPRRR